VLVVGDVKQSIYRWRNGDWTLLDREVEASLPGGNSQSLDTNFRSCRDLVRFNNHLIRSMIPVFTKNLEYTFEDLPGDEYNIESLYSDYKQTPHSDESPYGYVHFEILSDTEESTWKEQSVESMIKEMERLQSLGYSPGDMAVLTRKNKDASEIALRLMDYDKVSEYSFPVVSASSLDLIEHPAIKLIIAALTHITDPQNKMALNQLAFAYRKDILGETDYQPKPEEYSSLAVENSLMEALPKSYVDHYKELAAYPLFDLVENVILWFDLRSISGIYSYLTAFQDQILNYSERNSADISAFLLWFEKKNPSLDLPESSDAIVISTLHKAKGLQYKFVFIPVTDWDIEPRGGKTSLWLEPKHPPFNQYPVVMVNYSSDMKYSHFQGAYQDEYFKKQVDMLNMFYVAITRAEEGLWMWAPEVKTSKKPSKSDALSKMSDILVKSMMQSVSEVNDTKHYIDSWEDAWNDSRTLFRLGEIIPLKDGNVKDSHAIIMDNYGLNIRDNRLRYHHPEAFINLNQDEMIRDKIERGSVAHEVLEKTFKQVDLPEAIENVVRTGRIGREDAVILENQLESAMSKSQIKEWFNGDFEVLNEHEIILPDGNIIKPDRVMVYDDSTVVVDYKFGKKHSKHYLPQVTSYMDALKSMGYPNVHGYIWYVFLDEVQEVTA
jgi:ATP-dependent exoDNAse (exonuclease V) beta subunit